MTGPGELDLGGVQRVTPVRTSPGDVLTGTGTPPTQLPPDVQNADIIRNLKELLGITLPTRLEMGAVVHPMVQLAPLARWTNYQVTIPASTAADTLTIHDFATRQSTMVIAGSLEVGSGTPTTSVFLRSVGPSPLFNSVTLASHTMAGLGSLVGDIGWNVWGAGAQYYNPRGNALRLVHSGTGAGESVIVQVLYGVITGELPPTQIS